METVYHLLFRHPAHFGLEGIGQENIEQTVRSDTLWGAIIHKWLLLYRDNPDELCNNPPFSVSSCFPLVHGRRFYPAPLGSLDRLMNLAACGELPGKASVKDVKKINYLAEPLFHSLLQGKVLEPDIIVEKSVLPAPASHDEPGLKSNPGIMQSQRPRIRTDQLAGGVESDGFFYCTDQFFADDSGLFFLARFDSDKAQTKFEAALSLLGDSGLGADRSVGRGYFTIKKETISTGKSRPTGKQVLLSLYHPSEEEVQQGILAKGASSYSLIRRYGRGGASTVNRFRRADCWMLAEGSVLPFAPVGKIPCVLNAGGEIPHNVYRYGRAFCLETGGGQ